MSYTHTMSGAPRNASWFYRMRVRRRRLKAAADTGTSLPTVAKIADVENLVDVAEGMRGSNGDRPGPDGVRPSDLGRRDLFNILRPVGQEIQNGTYRPGRTRKARLPKPDGGYRTLSIGNLVDRIVGKALTEARALFWEKQYPDWMHGFRKGHCPSTLLAALANAVDAGYPVLVADDIKTAFDCVLIADVIADHETVLPAELMDKLIKPVVTGNDMTKAPGIAQGNPYSPTCLNVRLQRVFAGREPHALGGIPGTQTSFWVYADNLVGTYGDITEAEAYLQSITQTLAEVGFALKGENGGKPVDLRERGASVHLLGFVLFLKGGKLQLKLGPEAWNRLVQALKEAQDDPDPREAARAVIRGWIASHGPTFRKTDRLVQRVVELAGRYGFPDLETGETYGELCAKAWQRWQGLRARQARQPQQRLQGPDVHVPVVQQDLPLHDDLRLRRDFQGAKPAPEAGEDCDPPLLFPLPGPAGLRPALACSSQTPVETLPMNPPPAATAFGGWPPLPGKPRVPDAACPPPPPAASPPAAPPGSQPMAPRWGESEVASILRDLRDEHRELRREVRELRAHLANAAPAAGKTEYTTAEVAALLNRSHITVREWCRLGRVHATKRACSRGRHTEWSISREEVDRIRNEGLLPL